MNYQNNSRDVFFHLFLQYSAWSRTGSDPGMLLALRSRCRSSSRVGRAEESEDWTCREGQWTNPGGNAGGAAAALRAMEWHWHTGTELPAAAALPRQCHLGSPAQNVSQRQPLPQPQGSNCFSGMCPTVKSSEMFSSAQQVYWAPNSELSNTQPYPRLQKPLLLG